MKDYGKFIKFIVFSTAGILVLNSIIPCSVGFYGVTLPCPVFSVGMITFILTAMFIIWDKFVWRVKITPFPLIAQLLGFHDYPDLTGEWTISYESSYKYDYKNNQYTTQGEGKATIKQSYSSLFVYGDF